MSIWAQLRTLPNLLSLLRLALVPVFLVLIITGHSISAFLVLALASFTDWLDGYLARRLNQVTRIGALLDPAADRLYIFATLIGLANCEGCLTCFHNPCLGLAKLWSATGSLFWKSGNFCLAVCLPAVTARRLVDGCSVRYFADCLGLCALGSWALLVCRFPLCKASFTTG